MRTTSLLLLTLAAVAGCDAPAVNYSPRLFNTAPVALIETAPTAPLAGSVTLDGSRSYDPDGDAIAYTWRVHAAPADSALPDNPFDRNGDRNAVLASFLPDVLGRYTLALQVDDGMIVSDSAHVIVDVVPEGTPPEADAGTDGVGLEGAEVCLDGAGSFDPLGGNLEYGWTLAARPDGSVLVSADVDDGAAEACFVPDAPGLYTFGLTVTAGGRTSAPDYVDVTVASTNQPPLAAFAVLNEESCAYVGLDASASADPDGDALGYRWHLLLRPPGSTTPLGPDAFDDAGAQAPSFYADLEGDYLVQLAVFDGEHWSEPVALPITATEKLVNTPPVVDHPSDIYYGEAPNPCQAGCPTKYATLDASDSIDPDGDPVTVTWEVVSGPGSLDLTEGPTTELVLPGPTGSCSWGVTNETTTVVRLTATDCSGDTDSTQVVVLYSCAMGL